MIELARQILGSIDLDHTSTPVAQQVVVATTYYIHEDIGLTLPWFGNVWLNPPYSYPEPFVQRLLGEYASGRVTAALLLTNNATDTGWFHAVAGRASVWCLLARRL